MDLNNDHQVTVKDFFDVAVYQNNAYSALNIQLPSKPLNPDDEKYNIISANPDYVANIYASGSKQLKNFGSNQDDNIFANNCDLASIIKAGDGHIRFGVKSNTKYNLDTINSGYTNVGSGIHC